ncbi:MAG: ATP-binding cassette domain-containing protein [Thermodesulfobacteriota bacterium]
MDRDNSFFRVEGLSKAFGGLQAVAKATFQVEKGSLTSLIGPNGAGKTVSLGLARTFQHLGLFNQLSVWDNIFLALPAKRRERLWGVFLPRCILRQEEQALEERTGEVLGFLGLREKAGERVANLSWGDQKLVSIGRLLATDGEFLLLDEPASGLSDEQIDHLKTLLRGLISRGKTILLIDHNMEAVMDISDWVIVLNFGEIIAEGKPAEILANEEVVRIYLGV